MRQPGMGFEPRGRFSPSEFKTYVEHFKERGKAAMVDPWGLNACHAFVDSLIEDWKVSKDITDLGRKYLAKRNTTLSDVTGFKESLISGGQAGAVSRHIYGHAGAILRFGFVGGDVSLLNQVMDYFQRYQKGRTESESKAEIAGDIAG